MTDARPHHQPSTPAVVPPSYARYVSSIEFWSEGATLDLTILGLTHGRTDPGAIDLARLTRSLDGWKGDREEGDIAGEIKAHCIAWRWLPPLRGRANPVDLEFYMPWPQNLVLSMLSVLRRCLRRRSTT